MPFDPTEVRSRDELLMGAIATGDSSVIGDPRDRTEEFIKAIADGIGGAGGQLFLHHLSTVHSIDSHTLRLYINILSDSSTPITTTEDLKTNIGRVIDVYGHAVISTYAAIINRLQLTSQNVLRMVGIKFEIDSDTGTVTFAQVNIDVPSTAWADDIVQEL